VDDDGGAERIDKAIMNFLEALKQNEVKLSVADVMRLVELRKELAHNEVREVKVQWVEYNPAPFVSKK